ncbi:MAG: serine/threonine-protein kinase [Pseudomonadota bacterium]
MKYTAAEYAELSPLLDEALELPAEGRTAWLEALDGTRASWRPALARLLGVGTVDDVANPLDVARHVEAVVNKTGSSAESVALLQGGRIDSYELIRELGRGGMGTVWLARRVEGLKRRLVALKLPHPGLFSAELAERIERERDILEGLDHPNIARLYDAGVSAAGQPYLALEYVEGIALNAYCDDKRLDLRQRITLFLQVLEAVQFAHTHLVIHRDLKPANILVTEQGKVVLLDFGIAKLLTSGATEETALTRLGGRALTLDYASPEQIAGRPLTTASDVYSLGVVLYELICGERPYRLSRDSVAILEQAILNADIRVPSQAVTGEEAAHRRSTSARKLTRQLQGDLDTILLKTLRASSADRYHTADAFAADLESHLAGHAVQARRESLWYRTRKFVVRHRTAVASVTLVFVALSVGLGVALWQARLARAQAQRAEAVQNFLISIFESSTRNQADPIKARNKTARELLGEGETQLAQNRDLPAAERLTLLRTISQLYNELELYDEAAALATKRIELLRTMGKGSEVDLAEALTSYGANLLQASHTEAALPALREAETLLARNGKLDTWSAGYTYSYLAQALHYSNGAAALEYAERATKVLGREAPDSEANLGALWMLADAKRARDAPAAEAAMHDAMNIALKLYGKTAPLYGDSAMLLADIQADQLKFDAANRNFQIAENVAAHSTEGDDHLVIQNGLRYGRFLVDNGKVLAGQALIERALSRSIAAHGESDRTYTAWSREYAALAWWRRGQLDRALDQVERSLKIYAQDKPDDVTAKISELRFDLLLPLGNIPAAREALQFAHQTREKTGTATESGFKQGLMLRDAALALATNDAAPAESLYREVASAPMPPNLRFRRYRLEAAIGIGKVKLLRGDSAGALSAADRVLSELRKSGDPAVFTERQVEALILRGRSFAASRRCSDAQTEWASAAALLKSFEDPGGYRLKNLAKIRVCDPG